MDRFEKRDFETKQRVMADRERALTEALVTVAASLRAAISLLERTPQAKKGAPSDKMFAQMLIDYKKALNTGTSAFSASPPEQPAAATETGWEWRRIEFAPRDRFIFLFCPEDNSRWLAKWQDGRWYGVDDLGLSRQGASEGNPDVVTGWFVSHWMPLPTVPNKDAQA